MVGYEGTEHRQGCSQVFVDYGEHRPIVHSLALHFFLGRIIIITLSIINLTMNYLNLTFSPDIALVCFLIKLGNKIVQVKLEL